MVLGFAETSASHISHDDLSATEAIKTLRLLIWQKAWDLERRP